MDPISTTTWWLEMTRLPTETTFRPLPEECMVMQMKEPSRSFYLFLYTAVGRSYQWYNRLMMSASALEEEISSAETSIWVLYCKGVPAGFVEYSHREENETEMVYFGLVHEFTGRGLGLPFLQWCIAKAWERPIQRFWLHTCDIDHKAALGLYQKAGFSIFDEDTVQQERPDPEDDPYRLLPW
jgi:RimJ/RimL family protein N-acetyltransferase